MAKVEDEVATVGTLSVKLPTFWPDMPEKWFAQAEANFRARRISSNKTKLNLVVVALDPDTLKGVLDLIEEEPDEESYGKLKARLVQSFQLSPVDKIKKAMEMPALTDESPVKLADKMIALTRGASAEEIVKTMFLAKLPDEVRKVMWAEPLSGWTEMKARANRLWHAEKDRSRPYVNETEVASAGEQEANAVRAARKGGRNSGVREFARTFQQLPGGPCVFHYFFGKSATRCRDPCSQAGNGRAGRQ